jgi:Protein of unknown function (DUF4244)
MQHHSTPRAGVERTASRGPARTRPSVRRTASSVVRRIAGERGAATAEYAVATMAAVGFAGLLVVILRGDEVRGILTDLVRNALTVG